MTQKTYKVRTAKQNGQIVAYSIALPPEVGRALNEEMRFVCELRDEGILYRPAGADETADGPPLPAWAYPGEHPTRELPVEAHPIDGVGAPD